MKPGATLGLSHGFLLGVMQNDGVDFREDINVILNAPKVSFRATQLLLRFHPQYIMVYWHNGLPQVP